MNENIAGFYKHYAGIVVCVLGIGLNIKTGEEQVFFICPEIYCGYPKGTIFYDNAIHFFEERDLGNGKMEKRYVKINKEASHV
jgi:hypothetical protein